VTSLDSTTSFGVSSLGLLSSSEAKKKYEYCANENLTTGNLLINVVIFIFPLANLEELKILAVQSGKGYNFELCNSAL